MIVGISLTIFTMRSYPDSPVMSARKAFCSAVFSFSWYRRVSKPGSRHFGRTSERCFFPFSENVTTYAIMMRRRGTKTISTTVVLVR